MDGDTQHSVSESGASAPQREGTPCVVVDATLSDAPSIYECVNLAYKMEEGDSGQGFKTLPRYWDGLRMVERDLATVAASQGRERFLVIHDANYTGSGPQPVLACVRVSEVTDESKETERHCEFGPYAVRPEHQGTGLGRALYNEILGFARAHDCSSIRIGVVNYRTDVMTFYLKHGFVETGTGVFDPAFPKEYLTRPVHFVLFQLKL